MAFLSSPATPLMRENNQKPVYQFKVLSNGLFQPSEDHGQVSLKHFCLKTTAKRKKRKSRSKTPSGKRGKGNIVFILMVMIVTMFPCLYRGEALCLHGI